MKELPELLLLLLLLYKLRLQHLERKISCAYVAELHLKNLIYGKYFPHRISNMKDSPITDLYKTREYLIYLI